MRKSDVIDYYREQGKNLTYIANLLGLRLGSVSGWPEIIPERNALKLERITKRKLRYDPALYQKPKNDLKVSQ
ncbi:MAG: Cro/CI family transcriptional regulator [Plesiomonas sp.]|uniref:Cro/CI family transcriptional regulator n=1 Tax=Plesiomonas sp. TaxID=2486279 RepID=UPI003EE762CF